MNLVDSLVVVGVPPFGCGRVIFALAVDVARVVVAPGWVIPESISAALVATAAGALIVVSSCIGNPVVRG